MASVETSKPGSPDSETINLSTGSVSFPVSLVSLSGRNGFNFDLSLYYSSKGVRQVVSTWNEEVSTGVLGLGWSFPQEKILRVSTGGFRESSYYLFTGNTIYPLLQTGVDKDGTIYESEKYEFWRIRYVPGSELWVVTKEDGTRYVYGGGVQQTQEGLQTSVGNSIEWGVRWGDWIGPSNTVTKQEQYPIAWNLSSIQDSWGEQLAFTYEQDQEFVGTAGSGRKKYTQACRLSQVRGATGEKVVLSYGPEKGTKNPYETRLKAHTLHNGGPDAYQDRLEIHFLDALDVFNEQDERVARVQIVYAALGSGEMQKQILKTITHFNHEGRPSAPSQIFTYYGECSVDGASVSKSDMSKLMTGGALYGECSVDGVSVSKSDMSKLMTGGALFGALKSILTPQGATIVYQYAEIELPHAQREIAIPRPSDDWEAPQTYFGPDYAVVIWRGINDKYGLILVSAYQWCGRWVPAGSLAEVRIHDANIIAPPEEENEIFNFQVEIAAGFFAVVVSVPLIGQGLDQNHELSVHLFSKKTWSNGQWSYSPQQAGSSTDFLLASGVNFCALLDKTTGQIHCYTQDGEGWRSDPVFAQPLKIGKNPRFGLVAGDTYLFAISADADNAFQPECRIYALDALRTWKAPIVYQNEYFVPLSQENVIQAMELSLKRGTNFVSLLVSVVQRKPANGSFGIPISKVYRHFIYRWTETTLGIEASGNTAEYPTEDAMVTQVVVGDMIIIDLASAKVKMVCQYTGETWQSLVFPNDSVQNNYIGGNNSFSTTEDGQATYWEFNPNNGQWENGATEEGVVLTYRDGNPTFGEKFWVETWPMLSLVLGILTLPVGGGIELALNVALAGADLYSLMMTPAGPGGSGMVEERFLTCDNQVYYQDAQRIWHQIGELLTAEEAQKEIDPQILKYPYTQTLYKKQTLSFQDTQIASSFILYDLQLDKYSEGKGIETKLQDPPEYIGKVQLLKNGAFFTPARNLPAGEASHRSPDDETGLIGWNAFMTFQGGATLKEATSLKLYRVIQDDFHGPLKDVVVSQMKINDGYTEMYTHYEYETTSAECLPAATAAMYQKVTTIYSGAADTANRGNGYTESWFYAGDLSSLPGLSQTPTITNGSNYPALMTGRPCYTAVYNANKMLVSTATQFWYVFQKQLTSRDKGYYIRPVRSEVWLNDGSTRVIEQAYKQQDESGLPERTVTYNYNLFGEEEKHETVYTYGWEIYPQLRERHLLSAIGETATYVNNILTSLSATEWLPAQFYPAGAVPGQDLPLSLLAPGKTYQKSNGKTASGAGQYGDGWLQTSAVVSRNASYGVVTESSDVDGVIRTLLYDRDYRFPVASFIHASVEKHEAGYYGFEDYERTDLWQLTGTRDVSAYAAHAGQAAQTGQNARIEPRVFSPRSPETLYIVSAWVKPRLNGSGAQIGFGNDFKSLVADDYDWHYVEYVTNAPQANQKPFASCDGAIDDFRFGPVDAPFTATVYDPLHHHITEQLGTNGETVRFLYDEHPSLIATTGSDGKEVIGLSTERYSRDGEHAFNAEQPNLSLSLVPRNGGQYYRTPPSRVTSSGMPGYEQSFYPKTAHYGIKLRVSTLGNSQQPAQFSIAFGNANEVKADAEGVELTHSRVPVKRFATERNPLEDVEWILLVLENKAFLFLDGKLIFCEPCDTAPESSVYIFCGPIGTVDCRDIFLLADPIVELTYTDGLGRVIQTRKLDGTASGEIVQQTLYDGWGHPAVLTKPLHTGTAITLAYQSDLVKAFDWSQSSGKMTGKLVDYYQQSSVQADGQKPEDAFYPYIRQIAEDSPLARIIETGAAGVEFKAGSSLNVCTLFENSLERSGLVHDLEVMGNGGNETRNFSVITTRYPFDQHTQSESVRAFDLQGRLIVQKSLAAPLPTSALLVRYEADGTQRITSKEPMLATLPKDSAGPLRYMSTAKNDFLGRIVETDDSDSGAGHAIYDRVGRQRFKLDADGAAEKPNRIHYWKYDALGRSVEEGLVFQNWDGKLFQSLADTDAAWPPESIKDAQPMAGWRQRSVYDVSPDHDTNNLKGRLQEVKTRDSDGKEVKEVFAYDLAGNVISTRLSVAAFDTNTRETRYTYDQHHNITSIIYPYELSGQPGFEVHYFYNACGQLASIGVADDPTRYASYEYNIDGTIKTEHLNKMHLQLDYRYDFQGHLLAIQEHSGIFSEVLSYRDANGVFKDGNIAKAIVTGSAFKRSCIYSYQYDQQGHLKAANDTVIEYDVNGNTTLVKDSTTSATYIYKPGTNQLQVVQRSPLKLATGTKAVEEKYLYSAGGNQTSGSSLEEMRYDPYSGLPRVLRKGDQGVEVQYDGRRQRVLKTSIDRKQRAKQEQRLYIRGINAYPLVEKTGTGESIYVYGPGGLVALSEDTRTFAFILKDHLGSTRVVLNEQNEPIATFNYLPFGDLMLDNSSPQDVARRFRYLFTGQEYDWETGLYNYRARLYDSELGRFLAPDPKRQFPSPYSYVNNNPLNFIDPTGEMFTMSRIGQRAVRSTRVVQGASRTLYQVTEGAHAFTVYDKAEDFAIAKKLVNDSDRTMIMRGSSAPHVGLDNSEFREIVDPVLLKQHVNGVQIPNAYSFSYDWITVIVYAPGEDGRVYLMKVKVGPVYGELEERVFEGVQMKHLFGWIEGDALVEARKYAAGLAKKPSALSKKGSVLDNRSSFNPNNPFGLR